MEKIGPVAYRLDLYASAMIHPTIHVSQLKVAHGAGNAYIPLSTEFQDQNVSEAILERKMVKRNNQAVTKVLVKWTGGTPEDATWDFLFDFNNNYPDFDLEDDIIPWWEHCYGSIICRVNYLGYAFLYVMGISN